MQHKNMILVWLAFLLLVSMACKIAGGGSGLSLGATEAPPIDFEATKNALSTQVMAQATRLAQVSLETQAAEGLAAEADATATAEALVVEQTQAAQSASLTEAPSVQATSTPAVNSAATQQAQTMLSVIQQLFDEGIVGANQGDYYRLDDFNESWAQLGYYQWWKTGYAAESFVLSADIAWESASDKANWPEAGCGIVFSEDSKSDHHLAYLSLDGYGRLAQVTKGQWKNLAAERYGKLDIPNGNAKIMLVVYDNKINFYVNGQRVTNAYDGSLNAGNIALTLLSGTNKDFGTRCQMSNIDLFIFE